MIPTAYITEWRQHAPWVSDAQVEQDLIISRALGAAFAVPEVAEAFAFRGGTALYKLHLPARRYSEDIDLVQVAAGPMKGATAALRARWIRGSDRPLSSKAPIVLRSITRLSPKGRHQSRCGSRWRSTPASTSPSRGGCASRSWSRHAGSAGKVRDRQFRRDIEPLLAAGQVFDMDAAAGVVLDDLVVRLPGAGWRGADSSLSRVGLGA